MAGRVTAAAGVWAAAMCAWQVRVGDPAWTGEPGAAHRVDRRVYGGVARRHARMLVATNPKAQPSWTTHQPPTPV